MATADQCRDIENQSHDIVRIGKEQCRDIGHDIIIQVHDIGHDMVHDISAIRAEILGFSKSAFFAFFQGQMIRAYE